MPRRYGYRIHPLRAACCVLPTGCCLAWVAAALISGLALFLLVLNHL